MKKLLDAVCSAKDEVIILKGESRRRNRVLKKPRKLDFIGDVGSPAALEKSDELYVIYGETILINNQRIPTVFLLDAACEGEISEVWWRIDDNWVEENDPNTPHAMRLKPEEIWPVDYEPAIEINNGFF